MSNDSKPSAQERLAARLVCVLVRVLALPALDGWTAVIIQTFVAGDVEAPALALMAHARMRELTSSIAHGDTSSASMAEAHALEAVHAVLTGQTRRAERSARFAAVHLHRVAVVGGGAP